MIRFKKDFLKMNGKNEAAFEEEQMMRSVQRLEDMRLAQSDVMPVHSDVPFYIFNVYNSIVQMNTGQKEILDIRYGCSGQTFRK